MDLSNPDIFLPFAIIGFCLLLIAVVYMLTRPRRGRQQIAVPEQPGTAQPRMLAAAPAIGRSDLADWHHRYGDDVKSWIQNHEHVLGRVSSERLQLDASNESLLGGHAKLAPIMRNAITDHPAPAMQAQLSAMIVASEATLHALKRNEYQAAERQHLTYLEYRDQWLQRLRQFTSGDSQIRQIREMTDPRGQAISVRPQDTGRIPGT